MQHTCLEDVVGGGHPDNQVDYRRITIITGWSRSNHPSSAVTASLPREMSNAAVMVIVEALCHTLGSLSNLEIMAGKELTR